MKGISLSLPIQYNKEDGPYKLTKSLIETVKGNFKNLLLCTPGERVMDPIFGVGLKALLFENAVHETSVFIEERLRSQVQLYMPFVSIDDFSIEDELASSNAMRIRIQYSVKSIKFSDVLEQIIIKD